jgi:hypothetical protein
MGIGEEAEDGEKGACAGLVRGGIISEDDDRTRGRHNERTRGRCDERQHNNQLAQDDKRVAH